MLRRRLGQTRRRRPRKLWRARGPTRSSASWLAPGDSLVTRSNGTQLAVVGPGNRIHYQMVQIGRDYGNEIEITSGLQGGESVVINPSDDVREGAEVKLAAKK